ncbi:DUF2490 domain-containing protein [Mariniflexile litorale]|uniref:DUF2490 domain-containing protein n=1 Tax=Mariniflexile litorale TaxID=3045158 RepID=A0AAU7EBE8_9FLAO|nr:DUF2490 domain-containing protein [Mariniflexile sp. KMM 9835]MDQ8212963.1 DUF2490 domain-containing protein [Mariniflexile sp. KMM 9835]
MNVGMLKDKFISLKILLLFLVSLKGFTQKNIENQHLLWVRYNLKLKISETYQIQQELEERTYWYPWRQHQIVARTHVLRSFGNDWKAGVAFTYSEQSLPNNPNIKSSENVGELRPQIEIYNRQALMLKLDLEHRFWTEFRFFEQSDGAFDFTNVRMRYRLELQYKVDKKVSLKVFDEIHLNIGNKITYNVFDQNRYGGSIQYMPIKDLGVELGYLNWFQQRQSGVDFYNRNIVRFTIHQNINFKAKV